MTRRRRIWCELLPPAELGASTTLAVLERFHLEPLIALPPARQTDEMASSLRALSTRGIRVGLWPLLTDEEGYWPSGANADRFFDRVNACISFAENAGAHVSTIAVDLEPPLPITETFLRGSIASKGAMLVRGAAGLRDQERRISFRAETEAFRRLARELSERGIETIASFMPMIILDLGSRAPLWQSIFRTPVEGAEWSVVSPMLYTSMIAASLPSKSMTSARALLYRGAAITARALGASHTSISIGLVGPGKLGDEPYLREPAELQRDVAAVLAAGVDDLALFSLEAVLARGPEPWLDAFTATAARKPTGVQTALVSGLVRAAVWAIRPLALFHR